MTTPALSAASQADNDRDKDVRSEAAQLTDELKSAGARPGKQPAIQAAVSGKAERRRHLLNRLAQTNPAAVLDLAMSPAERAALPANLRSAVEERVTVDGELVVLHHDFEDGHSEYEMKLVKGGQETPVKFGAPIGQAKPGDHVKSDGVALAGDQTVVTDSMVVIQSAASVGTTGNQHTAIVLVMAPGVGAHRYANKTNTASLFFDASPGAKSARAFYLEASYGQTTVTGANGTPGSASDVFGPFAIAATDCNTTNIRNQAFAAADPTLDFNAYHRIVLAIDNPACGGGVGTIRTQTVGTYDGNSQRVSISWDFNSGLGATTLNGKVGGTALHEYGHNLGVWHANSLECGSTAIGGSTCYSDEYGDPSDVMGSSGGYGHMNGVHKDILGWLGARGQVVSANGSYTVNQYEDGANNVKVLKVPRTRDGSGNVNGYYYLEYRKPTVNWTNFTSGRPEYGNGVLVHTSGMTPLCTSVCNPDFSGSGGGGDSNIVDTQPGSVSGTSDFNDAPLAQSQSFADSGAGVTMQVTATAASTATVSLTFGTPQRSVHTLVYPENAGSVLGGGTFAPGQTVTLTASPPGCFVNWRENRSNQSFSNPYTFTVTADRTLEAVFTTASCSAAPANDNFPGPTITTGQQSVNTGSATVQSGEPTNLTCNGASAPTGRTVWYTITPAATSQITLNTAGSAIDTVLAVYTGGAVNGLTQVACNDDTGGGDTSQVQFTGQAGTSYRVQVGGYNAAGRGRRPERHLGRGGVRPTPGRRHPGHRQPHRRRHRHDRRRRQELRHGPDPGHPSVRRRDESGRPALARELSPAVVRHDPAGPDRHLHLPAAAREPRHLEHDRCRALERREQRALESVAGQRPEPDGRVRGLDELRHHPPEGHDADRRDRRRPARGDAQRRRHGERQPPGSPPVRAGRADAQPERADRPARDRQRPHRANLG